MLVLKNTFDSHSRAINIKNIVPSVNYRCDILNNTFINVKDCAIQLDAGRNDVIKKNTFENNIFPILQSNYLRGIFLTNSSGFFIMDNSFNKIQNAIMLTSSGDAGGTIGYETVGNTFTSCFRGITAYNKNPKLTIRCNNFYPYPAHGYNKNIIISDEEFIKNFKIIKLIDTDQDVRYMIGDKIIKKLTYDKRLNLIVQFIDIIKPSILKIKICLENCVKFPFLIWCDCEYGYKKKYKKIYEMELCYKYNNLVFNLPRSFEYATDENIIFIWKQIYKYTKILVPYITSKLYEKISVDDDRIEKFLRQISKDNGLADTKRFLIYDDNLSLTKMKNYFDILTGIADFKWNNTGILNNIIFL